MQGSLVSHNEVRQRVHAEVGNLRRRPHARQRKGLTACRGGSGTLTSRQGCPPVFSSIALGIWPSVCCSHVSKRKNISASSNRVRRIAVTSLVEAMTKTNAGVLVHSLLRIPPRPVTDSPGHPSRTCRAFLLSLSEMHKVDVNRVQ